jgi:exodeoxyribonuclease-3
MRIATYNAASIRARMPLLTEWIRRHEPDVLVIQETKVEDGKFPFEPLNDLGYEVAIHGQKAWNGVATLSKIPIDVTEAGYSDEAWPNDARMITTVIEGITIINTYVPNGNSVGSEKWAYKMAWLERFSARLRRDYSPDDPLIWLGDINIAPTSRDVYDSKKMYGGVGHHPDEFARLAQIVDFGLVDLYRAKYPEEIQYTFWDFTLPRGVERNLGWRIDHIYATAPIASLCSDVWVDNDSRRWEKPSDHTFVVAELNL